MARNGKLDPVIGRDEEIRRVTEQIFAIVMLSLDGCKSKSEESDDAETAEAALVALKFVPMFHSRPAFR